MSTDTKRASSSKNSKAITISPLIRLMRRLHLRVLLMLLRLLEKATRTWILRMDRRKMLEKKLASNDPTMKNNKNLMEKELASLKLDLVTESNKQLIEDLQLAIRALTYLLTRRISKTQ